MSDQLNLFKTINKAPSPLLRVADVMRSAFVVTEHIIETIKWQEFHENGQLHIDGEIGIVADTWKHLYGHRTEWQGHKGKAVVRLGVWTNYYDNGQIWWQHDFGDSMYDIKVNREKFPSFRKDGTVICF